jgi:hypothetical protein
MLRLFQTGVLFERVGGVDLGHAHLNEAIHAWLVGLNKRHRRDSAR